MFYSLTIDNSNHSPQSKDDEERHCLKRFFLYPGNVWEGGRGGGRGLDLVHLFTVIDVLAEDSQRSRTWQNKYTYNSHIQ